VEWFDVAAGAELDALGQLGSSSLDGARLAAIARDESWWLRDPAQTALPEAYYVATFVHCEDARLTLSPVRIVVDGHTVVTLRMPEQTINHDAVDPHQELGRSALIGRVAAELPAASTLTAMDAAAEPASAGQRPATAELGAATVAYAILLAAVSSYFLVRGSLARKKMQVDQQYTSDVADARRDAAKAERPDPRRVQKAAEAAADLVDVTRTELLAILSAAGAMRGSFDEMKPPGKGPDDAIWLPDLKRQDATRKLVERIYQVRNDLRTLRHETQESLGMLTAADSASQLLAVRALLDRTDRAREAAIVAAASTVSLAAIALAFTIAAVPGDGARFAPLSKAAGLSGLSIVAVLGFGWLVAIASRRRSEDIHARFRGRVDKWLAAAGLACGVLAVVAFVLAFSASTLGAAALALGSFFLAASLLVVAARGDYG
jgi:hypothetical protein